MEPKYEKIQKKEDNPELAKKHLPIIEVENIGESSGVKVEVKVGEIEHPMDKDHFIQWIGIYDGEILLEKINLTPESKPRITFFLQRKPEKIKIREFCNIHGVWEY